MMVIIILTMNLKWTLAHAQSVVVTVCTYVDHVSYLYCSTYIPILEFKRLLLLLMTDIDKAILYRFDTIIKNCNIYKNRMKTAEIIHWLEKKRTAIGLLICRNVGARGKQSIFTIN